MSETDVSVTPVSAVVIMAAGAGTRMKSAIPKVLHKVAGQSMISWAVDAADALTPQRLVVVVGHGREQVSAHLAEVAPHVVIAVQEQQLGTGDAVRAGLAALGEVDGEVVVTSGDVPLLAGETLAELISAHRREVNAVTVLTAKVPDPTGYGRIVRDADQVSRIVEQADAGADELAIDEINSGIYVFAAEVLAAGIANLTTGNAQGEFYLTDVITHARNAGGRVGGWLLADHLQTEGVNDRIQLAERNAEANRRILRRWMAEGVTVIDPATTWVHGGVDLAADVTLLPGTSLEGATSVASGAVIGPDTTLIDVEVGENATVTRSHAELAVISAGATVGPFSYLRPGTELGVGGKIGAFVETKKAIIGAGSKVPHLAYCGDAVLGEGVNIGAGTIFANYDGVTKSTTTVGDNSFVGSDSVLVAPVDIAPGAYVAAGSTITAPVGPGELAVARGQQRNIKGWVARKRPGSKTEASARLAQEQGLGAQEDDK
ncbi:bifunctional UDP-N-acetylglucosamine diphosphorylase/glucosamine-1-phosphate N-acetyltransferase GlmU [Propionicimonas sp.]|uniref:bifunctional UDP-N-acetylglucosamine diphosphorylase/glucosamine-1-phosphate N-acetyltransferase GlmU n=1 Tax=Propionicimonas sp. TaxID=1955623 RepID=UPI0025E13F2C|nr:bifunctional UDP-N-acetylglucosamine diphosphorylase/glucosamine-1-phosphate N-acetyltransferase GlmU [Propionicimonas sp.]